MEPNYSFTGTRIMYCMYSTLMYYTLYSQWRVSVARGHCRRSHSSDAKCEQETDLTRVVTRSPHQGWSGPQQVPGPVRGRSRASALLVSMRIHVLYTHEYCLYPYAHKLKLIYVTEQRKWFLFRYPFTSREVRYKVCSLKYPSFSLNIINSKTAYKL